MNFSSIICSTDMCPVWASGCDDETARQISSVIRRCASSGILKADDTESMSKFLIPYVIFVILIGSTGVIEEMALGRATKGGPIKAFGDCVQMRTGKKKVCR